MVVSISMGYEVIADETIVTQVNDDSQQLTYTGNWHSDTDRYGGCTCFNQDLHYTMTPSDSFEISFVGTGIEYITEKGPEAGLVDIYIDGELIDTVNCYAASRSCQQVLYSKTDLSNGNHTFKAVGKTGNYFQVDCMKIFTSNIGAPSVSNVTIDGSKETKAMLEVNYVFNSSNDQEGKTTYRWLMADSANGTYNEILGVKTKTIVLTAGYAGKYVKCEVTPIDTIGRIGTTVTSSPTPAIANANGNPNTDWFKDAKYGISHHFLSDIINLTAQNEDEKWKSNETWDDIINGFDVDAYANQCEEAGVGFVLFTLGQNSGYFCSPNATYDQVASLNPGERCSTRDLPLALYEALSSKGIKLMLYLPSNPPHSAHKIQGDYAITTAFNYSPGKDTPPSQIAQEKWQAVIKEWGDRYGNKLVGWWFDGAWMQSAYTDFTKPYNWSSLANAAKSGNPSRIVSFNPGVNNTPSMNSIYEDYTAGESNNIGAIPQGRWANVENGIQWYSWTFLGDTLYGWGGLGTRRNTVDLVKWVKAATNKEGVVCLDVQVNRYGKINTEQFAQLKEVHTGLTSINDDSQQIIYTGNWASDTGRHGGCECHIRDLHYTTTTGDAFELNFTGTGVEYVTEKAPGLGLVDIYIDDILFDTVDCNAPSRSCQQVLYSKRDLSAGNHTFKAVKKTGTYFQVDYMKVYN